MERWLSGRKRIPAKLVDTVQGLSDANPDLSAILDQIINGDVLIGIELNQEYIDIAEKRINAVRQQLKLNFSRCAS